MTDYKSNSYYINYSCSWSQSIIFIFEFPCIVSLYYIWNQLDATLAVLFISNCKNILHVSDVYRVHHQEYIKCSSSHWCMSWVGMMYIQ